MTEPIQIQDIRKLGNRVEASVQHGEKTYQVFFESDDIDLAPRRETMVSLSLYPGMKAGADLEVNGNISPMLLKAIPHLQDVYHCWYPFFKYINLQGVEASPPKNNENNRRVALFFSGGLDCWYSLIKNQHEITDLVFIWGWELSLDDQDSFDKTLSSLKRVADAFGKHLIIIRTNMRTFIEDYIPLHRMYGTAMAGMAQMLSPKIGKAIISSEDWYTELMPAGAHVLVDPYWSTETMEIIHDGLEVTRLEKAMVVGQNELALQTLRVCWTHPSGILNCGRCEKCLRTMVSLKILGSLDRCTTFAIPFNPRNLYRLKFFFPSSLLKMEENYKALQEQPQHKKLALIHHRVLRRFYLTEFLHKSYPRLLPNLLHIKEMFHPGRRMK